MFRASLYKRRIIFAFFFFLWAGFSEDTVEEIDRYRKAIENYSADTQKSISNDANSQKDKGSIKKPNLPQNVQE